MQILQDWRFEIPFLLILLTDLYILGGRQKWVPLNLEGAEGATENSNNDAVPDKSPTSPEAASPTAVNPKPAKSPTNRFNSGGMPGNVSPVRGSRGGRGGMRGGRGGRGRQRSPRGSNISGANSRVFLNLFLQILKMIPQALVGYEMVDNQQST